MEYIPPIITKVKKYDVYAQVKIKGHREYEGLDVMCYENSEGRMFITAIITLRSGGSIRFINSQELIQNIKLEAPARKAYFCSIEYEYEVRHSTRYLKIRFFTHKNEEVLIRFVAGVSSYETKIPMFKSTGFVAHREIPIGFAFSNRRINFRTVVKINNREYRLEPTNNFFGLSYGSIGKMSEDYTRLMLLSLPERMNMVRSPEVMEKGARWKYCAGKRTLEFFITEISGESMTLTHSNEVHKVLIKEDKFYLKQISNFENPDDVIFIDFNPPIPIAPHSLKQTSKMTVVNNDIIIYEATLQTFFDENNCAIKISGDRGYLSGNANIAYELRAEDGWVFCNTIV